MASIIISIGGGKGGTGKSVVASNLAVALAQSGKKVVLFDGDLGAANQHTLFGIDRPVKLLEHFLCREVAQLSDICMATEEPNLRLICGGMPVMGSANPAHQTKMKLIRHLRAIDADVLICDVGAGTSFNMLDLFNFAHLRLAVFTAQLTSVHNGYGFLKAALHRYLHQTISRSARAHLVSYGAQAGEESIADMLTQLADFNVDEAERAKQALAQYRAFVVGNMVSSQREGFVINAVSQMIKDHLHLEARVIGLVRRGEKIANSVNARMPFMMRAGIESNAETFRQMATNLVAQAGTQVATTQGRMVDEAVLERYQEMRRRYPRFPLELPALLEGTDVSLCGHLVDVAKGGVGLVLDDLPDEPTDGMLHLGPLPTGETVEIPVRCRYMNRESRRVGFLFAPTEDGQRLAIERLVELARGAFTASSTTV